MTLLYDTDESEDSMSHTNEPTPDPPLDPKRTPSVPFNYDDDDALPELEPWDVP